MKKLYENECSEVSRSVTSEPKIHGITSRGFGNQIFSTGEPTWRGIWLQGQYDVENGFLDSDGVLILYTSERLEFLQQDYQWEVTTLRKMIMRPGDPLEWHPAHEAIETLSAITIEKNSDGETILELGAKGPDFSDSWEKEQNISSGYTSKYLQPSHEDVSGTAGTLEFYPYDPTHAAGPIGEINFAVPEGVLDADILPRITMDLSIDFKTTNTVLVVGSCAIEIKKGGVYLRGGNIIGWTPGTTIKEIDVTDWIEAGATNTFSIGVYMAANYSASHDAYTGHPALAASATLHFWKRKDIL